MSGMPRYIYKISQYLQKRGHTVEVVAGSTDNRKWKYRNILVHNAQWIGEVTGSYLNISKGIIKREYAIQKVLHEINRKNSIDLIQYAGWSGIGSMHSLPCPSVLRLSTYSKIQYVENELFKDYIKTYSFWERLAGRRLDGIIAPGKFIGEQFSKDVSKKVTIIETPFSNNIEENDLFYKKKLRGIRYMLYYGSFSKEKGFDTIGEMLIKFFKENEDFYFVCAGWNLNTNYGNSIENMRKKLGNYENRMIYLGLLQQEYLYPIIRNAEFILIPSLIDNLPNACLEALSLDKIVIGTYNTSLEQMISDGENGFLSEPGNADSLLAAVKKVCALTEEEKKQMSKKNKKILNKFSVESAVTKLEKYYCWLIDKHSKRWINR